MTQTQRENSHLIWWIAGGLFSIVLAIIVFFQMNTPPRTEHQTLQIPKTENQSKLKKESAQPTPTPPTTTSELKTLVNDDLLKQQIPTSPSLAKEEMTKLDDIQKQLHDQANTLKDQHIDAEQLIKLKEEQIKLLESQMQEHNKI
ncbi:hypothetical protein [Acinetobacter stercoris]|uniref:Uncharacterized protein n=1 Tax=Acinetobacter stercoris TaxID=2126983 RepID=A0A2U3MUL7_9GAMM|nr:hypothetical protein [Acinetobacter stercoris]SPL69116.1 hypothetical protein KPC_0294 [Acinetobacter stercoris]